jgi:hypothetical protein
MPYVIEGAIGNMNIITCLRDSRRRFGLDIGITALLNTQLVITLNYSAIADLHTLQITTAYAKSFQTRSVFTSSCLVTAPTMAIPLLRGSKFFFEWRLPSNFTKPVRVTLRLAVYRQLVRLCAKPLETHDQFFFFQLNARSYSNILSDEKVGLSLMNMRGLSSRVHFAFIACC